MGQYSAWGTIDFDQVMTLAAPNRPVHPTIDAKGVRGEIVSESRVLPGGRHPAAHSALVDLKRPRPVPRRVTRSGKGSYPEVLKLVPAVGLVFLRGLLLRRYVDLQRLHLVDLVAVEIEVVGEWLGCTAGIRCARHQGVTAR